MRRVGGGRAVAIAAMLGVALPLWAVVPSQAQQQSPESLLPPGFGDPVPEAAPTPPPPRPTPTPPAGTPAPPSAPDTGTDPAATPAPTPGEEAAAEAAAQDAEARLAAQNLPAGARRDPRFAGVIGAGQGGLGDEAWGDADGRYLSRLMRGVRTPIASRWASILLRRALAGNGPAPANVAGADWAAERAWLLVRMGEANMARALVQAVDVDRYSPKMVDVAMQAALATGDPAGLCPVTGVAAARWPGWDLARAWCAALAGEPGTGQAIIDATRRRLGGGRSIDILLAEKVANAAGGRRATTIQWDGITVLNSWRYGLARATGVAIPETLVDGVGPQVRAWSALSPMLTPEERLPHAAHAARLGVLSNIAYVDLMGAVGDATDPSEFSSTPAARLREAYAAGEVADRLTALRTLWGDGSDADARYAALVLTARAAARIPAGPDHLVDAPSLLGAMLTAGFDVGATGWGEVIASSDDRGDAWAIVAVATPTPELATDAGDIANYAGSAPAKGRLLIAGLAGLGRIDEATAAALARDHGVPLGRRSSWSDAIDRAADRQQPATVALLAAVGLQAAGWRGVPPDHLFHIVRALTAVGLDAEARMIAAEAVVRA